MSETGLRIIHTTRCKKDRSCMDGFAQRFADLIVRANESGRLMHEADIAGTDLASNNPDTTTKPGQSAPKSTNDKEETK